MLSDINYIYVSLCIYLHILLYIQILLYIYTYIYTHYSIYIYTNLCIYVYMYIHLISCCFDVSSVLIKQLKKNMRVTIYNICITQHIITCVYILHTYIQDHIDKNIRKRKENHGTKVLKKNKMMFTPEQQHRTAWLVPALIHYLRVQWYPNFDQYFSG